MVARSVIVAVLLMPPGAVQYHRTFLANIRVAWGLSAPIAPMAAQVHQESGWRPNAQSVFAVGLAQFTPGTAEWASRQWPDLSANQPFEPAWAFRALGRYDKFLYDRVDAATDCDRWAFALSAYNGGEGWRKRDQALATQHGYDPTRWWGAVELFSPRSRQAFTENRGYPRRILRLLEPLYRTWGRTVCSPSSES